MNTIREGEGRMERNPVPKENAARQKGTEPSLQVFSKILEVQHMVFAGYIDYSQER